MPVEFGTAKTVFILAIVVGCFAVLWPKLFYPMLQASVTNRAPPDQSQACCDVYFESDINAIKIMAEMCGNILHHHSELDPNINQAFLQGKWSKEMVNTCRSDVLEKCGVDITAFLNEKVRLGHSYKQMLDGIRSFNISVCLKTNFGVPPSLIGAPRRMRILNVTRHIRQERPPHLRPEMLHPALRERGRAIPQSHIVPKVVEKEGRPGPIPGMRPPMGGAGHVVPAPKTSGTMGIIMPMYTIGIVIFFLYTIMKVMFKKPSDNSSGYGDFQPDPEFRKIVFAEDYDGKSLSCEEPVKQRIKSEPSPVWKTPEENGTKLVMTAITGLIAEVDLQREILEKRAGIQNNSLSEKKVLEVAPEMNNVATTVHKECEKESTISDKLIAPVESSVLPSTEAAHDEKNKKAVDIPISTEAADSVSSPQVMVREEKANQKVEFLTKSEEIPQPQQQGQVVVVGMDVTASCEGGGRWSRPGTPLPPSELVALPTTILRSRSSTPAPFTETETQSIVLEAPLPSHSQLLVSDSETHAEPTGLPGSADADPPVVLSGKVTLSLISLQEALAAEEQQEQKEVQKSEQEHQPQGQQQINQKQVSNVETVRAVRANVIEDEEEEEEEEVEVEVEEDEEEEEEEEEEEDEADLGGGAVPQNTEQVRTAETENQSDQAISETSLQQLVNDAHPGDDETPTTTNYTTASGAAEATSTTGTEETAADMSALESFGTYDEQQDDDIEIENQEVWNGEVQSEEEESEDEAELQPPNVQQ